MSERQRLPNRRESSTFEFDHGGIRYTASASFFPEGALAELFLRGGKTGSSAEIAAHDGAIILSIALQHGVPLNAIQHALQKLPNGSSAGPLCRAIDLIEAGAYA